MPENLPAKIDMEITALAERFPILNPASADEIREVLQANIGPRGLTPAQMDRIKVPSGGAQLWSVTGIDGEEAIRELSGIALAWTDSRLYYKVAYAERGKTRTPPDCASKDAIYGIGDPGGDCRHCPMAEWASDPKGGRGQACKEVRRILFLRGDHILPEMITIPPTSLKNAQEYFKRLGSLRIPHWALITNLRLERTANADGIDYARVILSAGPRFNEAERAALAPYQAQMASLFRDVEIDTTDFEHRDNDND